MGDCLRTAKPPRYVTSCQVVSAFYSPWDGKMGINFQAEY